MNNFRNWSLWPYFSLGLIAAIALIAIAALVAAAGPATAGAFPGQNGKIVFQTSRDGNLEIYAINPDGSDPTNLTKNPLDDFQAQWSADGSKIVFGRRADPSFVSDDIFVMNADGSGQTKLTSGGDNFGATWSPDGSKIAFTTLRDGGEEIYVMNADGSGQTNITNNPALDFWPSWSPDGKKIAFTAYRDVIGGVATREIYVMNADGSDQTRLTLRPDGAGEPSWSPDGSKIAFESGVLNGDIYTMNANGSDQVKLTTDPAADQRPAWSPDGTKIAFDSTRDGNPGNVPEIYVMNTDGSDQTRLTSDPASDGLPNWQPLQHDKTPPVITCSASPDVLWPPNHKLVSVTATVTVTDAGSGPAGFTLVSVMNSQADSQNGGDPPNDIQDWALGTPDVSGQFRAERYGSARTYTLTYEGKDSAGNTATCSTTVVVPHQMS